MITYGYDPFSAATSGTASNNAFCLATDGFLCPSKRWPAVIALPPTEGLRDKRDMRDLQDILTILERTLWTT